MNKTSFTKTMVSFGKIALYFSIYFVFSSFQLNQTVIQECIPTWTADKFYPYLNTFYNLLSSFVREQSSLTLSTPIMEEAHLCNGVFNASGLCSLGTKTNSIGFYLLIGFYYGISLLGIFSTLFIYKLFHIKKWLLLIISQVFILCLFIYNDLCLINRITDDLWLSVTYNYIFVTTLITLFLLLINFSSFSIKRTFRDYELKIYLFFTTLSCVVYFLTDTAPRYFDILVILLAITTFYLLFKQKKRIKYNTQYSLLFITKCSLYSLCLAPLTQNIYLQFETLDNVYLKLLVIITTLFILLNNYSIINKVKKDHKTNKILNAQYIMMLKTYHKQLKEHLEHSNSSLLPDIQETEQRKVPTSYLQKKHKLTDREIDVLKLLLDGLSNKEISNRLEISESTTKYHISNIYTKLAVSSRNQLFALQLFKT